ncbi:MAG: peptidyl-prolyl cis-trans isomerase [Bacteroidales bacterium]|nr:peptidyl-prolyl cis-trans isomerase [Bacteroidales bacterium]
MMKKILSAIFLSLAALAATAQQKTTSTDRVIFEIDGKPVMQSEFLREFKRSIGQSQDAPTTACTYEKRQKLEEYVQLFVNFRTKLVDAHNQGFDTTAALSSELASYRDELAAPYLIDSLSLQRLLQEAYERNHYAVRAAHILIKLKKTASPADTLQAYNRAMEVYQRATGGADFLQLAREVSEDQSARDIVDPDRKTVTSRGNSGDLGFFSVFNMVYPFESAAYALQPGQISKPVRSSFGYHIIKMLDKVPYYGKSSLQHIWLSDETTNAEGKIREAYRKLQSGENFGVVARNYSDDRGSAANGGLLPDMAINQMPPEYVKLISQMPLETYSEPFHTEYGWHIIRVVKKEQIPSFEEMAPYYRQRLSRDQRSTVPQGIFIDNMKKRYHFEDYTQMLRAEKPPRGSKAKTIALPVATLNEAVAAMTDSVFRKRWHYADSMITDLSPLFAIGDRKFNARDLLHYIESNQRVEREYDYATYVQSRYNDFINQEVLRYADSRLEQDNADFRELLQEYRNGLLIFSYNDKMIWSRAMADTAGLKKFYEEHSATRSLDNPDHAPYFWNTRARVTIVTVADSNAIPSAKATKIVQQAAAKRTSNGTLRSTLISKVGKAYKDANPVEVRTETLERGKQETLTDNQWRQGTYYYPAEKGYTIVVVEQITPPTIKSLSEARGYYINDYQDYLEGQLMQQLRQRYNVKIHQDVVDETYY